MATKTFDELKQLAIQIRDEKTNKQNTANRVGTAMLEGINKLEQDYYDKTAADEEFKKQDDKLTELANNVGLYNVDKHVPLGGGFYTSATARAAVPSDVRKVGLIITYKTDATTSVTEQFIGSDVSGWTTDTNWKNVGSEGGNKILEWKTDAATTRKKVPVKERKAGMQISYKPTDSDWVNEQYVGTSFTDTEWGKDVNWTKISNNIESEYLASKYSSILSKDVYNLKYGGDEPVDLSSFSELVIKKGYYNISGEIVTINGYICTEVNIPEGYNYMLAKFNVKLDTYALKSYFTNDENENLGVITNDGNYEKVYEIPKGATKARISSDLGSNQEYPIYPTVRFCKSVNYTGRALLKTELKPDGLGYDLNSNITGGLYARKISDWVSLNYKNGFYTNTGSVTSIKDYVCTEVDILEGYPYVLIKFSLPSDAWAAKTMFVDQDGAKIGDFLANDGHYEKLYKIPEGAKILKITSALISDIEYKVPEPTVRFAKEAKYISPLAREEKLNDIDWTALGDSISTDGKYVAKGEHYYDIIAKEENMIFTPDDNVIATVGRTLSYVPEGNDMYGMWPCILDSLGEVRESSNLITILAGINDFGYDIELGEVEYNESGIVIPGSIQECYTFKKALCYLFYNLKKSHPEACIMYIEPMMAYSGEKYKYKNKNNNTMCDFWDAIEEVASIFSVPVIKMGKEIGVTPYIPEQNTKYFSDGLHPNRLLQSLMAVYLKKQIKIFV